MLQLLHIHSGVRFIDCKPPAAFGDAARTWCVRSCRPRGVGGQQSQSFSTRYIGPTRAFSIKTGKESNWTLRQTDPEGLQPVTKFSKLKGGYGPLKIFSGNAHPELAKQLADRLGVSVAGATVNNFANGETQVLINNSVRECDVYVVQPTCNPKPNQYLMELLIMLDACRRGGARRTTAVMPIFGYARQDKKDRSRGPIAAKLVANMLHVAGADRVVTVDLHSSQIQGFADFSIDNLYALPLLAAYIKEAIVVNGTDCVVVSPDAGGAKRADIVAKELQCDIAIFSKTRKAANTVDSMTLVGDVQGKAAILVDDMCDTGGTLVMAARVSSSAHSLCSCT
jgi:ribose-phosphate pyrophosphokinase